ncbi:hypothetical protein BOTBODRAFT_117246 [Botryobasidium botryosum FD-172 SS1]|uniref:Uncharacterized protein n=1 Tax=Botryobasidium botryosum (strain FD-172 SS1) TaxID=930990 RepID=A0A067M0U4_BOTB1|nr:hypothetical protein BOTBODRAFT_117246 [Botryobasidium botryosum FD-172 SS1]
MGVFYAYAKNVNDDWRSRYLIVFASRSVADEWWRAVSESGTRFSNIIRRISPQFYTHDYDVACIADTIKDVRVAGSFLGKVFFTLLNDKDSRILSVIPEQNITDHISGNLFHIRSKSDPREFWYCPPDDDRVYASRKERTQFRIRLRREGSTDGTVMIGSDEICLSKPEGGNYICMGTDGCLVAAQRLDTFKFGDLEGGFECKRASKTIVKTNVGERWELV